MKNHRFLLMAVVCILCLTFAGCHHEAPSGLKILTDSWRKPVTIDSFFIKGAKYIKFNIELDSAITLTGDSTIDEDNPVTDSLLHLSIVRVSNLGDANYIPRYAGCRFNYVYNDSIYYSYQSPLHNYPKTKPVEYLAGEYFEGMGGIEWDVKAYPKEGAVSCIFTLKSISEDSVTKLSDNVILPITRHMAVGDSISTYNQCLFEFRYSPQKQPYCGVNIPNVKRFAYQLK